MKEETRNEAESPISTPLERAAAGASQFAINLLITESIQQTILTLEEIDCQLEAIQLDILDSHAETELITVLLEDKTELERFLFETAKINEITFGIQA